MVLIILVYVGYYTHACTMSVAAVVKALLSGGSPVENCQTDSLIAKERLFILKQERSSLLMHLQYLSSSSMFDRAGIINEAQEALDEVQKALMEAKKSLEEAKKALKEAKEAEK